MIMASNFLAIVIVAMAAYLAAAKPATGQLLDGKNYEISASRSMLSNRAQSAQVVELNCVVDVVMNCLVCI